jgi:hypothetical protein
MKLADIVGGKVVIHPDMLLIPSFNKLYTADVEKATKTICYIVMKNKWDSPYVMSMGGEEVEKKLKEEYFGSTKYKLSVDEQIAENEYCSFQDTKTLQMLRNMRLKLDSISDYYKESLGEELDEKKIKDLLVGMTSVGNVLKSLDSLEQMVKAEEIVTSKIRGDAKINPFELPQNMSGKY